MADKLTEQERSDMLAPLLNAGWALDTDRDAITKTFNFRNFVQAFGWMTEVAITAEKMNHHPEWSNVYKTVNVLLTTHDANGLTDLDIRLARAMDKAQ